MYEITPYQHKELYHYGVKGMKWGVRKDRYVQKAREVKKNIHDSAQIRKQQRAEKQRADILKSPSKLRKHYKEFSDEEVRKALKNLDIESRLDNLSQQKVQNGAKNIKRILGLSAATVAVTSIAIGAAQKGSIAKGVKQGFLMGDEIGKAVTIDKIADATGGILNVLDSIFKRVQQI